MKHLIQRSLAAAWFWYNFIRLPLLGFTLLLPLVGALASGRHPSALQVFVLLLVGLSFHCFAYVLNDVVDLPLDRGEPLRADFPLVRGEISPTTALIFALAQIPLAGLLTLWLGGDRLALIALGSAYALIALYDIWGKRTPWPPLIDFLQGIGWGALVVYGAAIVGAGAAPAVLACAVIVTLYITLLNGVHGGLRDLANDLACGARTTAIVFGARPDERGGATITPLLVGYTLGLQGLLGIAMLTPVYGNWFGYRPAAWGFAMISVTLLLGIALVILLCAPRLLADRWAMLYAGSWHLLLLLSGLVLMVAPLARPWLAALLGLIHLFPLLINAWIYRSLIRLVRARFPAKGANDARNPAEPTHLRSRPDHAD